MSGGRRAKRAGAILAMGALFALFSASSGGCDMLKSKSEKKAFGEACAQVTDCESGECATYGSICTKSCTLDKDCGAGLVCRVKEVGTGNECSKPYGIAPGPTAACNAASECQHAQCLRKVGEATGPGICSKFCADVTDCPDGMKICESISDSAGLKMCLPGEANAPSAARPVFVAPKPKVTDGGAPDGAAPPVDAAAPPVDAAAPKPDAAAPPVDAAAPPVDAAAPSDGGRPKIRPIFPKK
jgi:hypothetical protein